MIYFFCGICVKLSLFALYHRLFDVSRSTRVTIYIGSAVVALFYLASAALQLALCVPRRQSVAQRSRPLGLAPSPAHEVAVPRYCPAGAQQRFIVQAAFSSASNLFLFFLPLRIVWRMRLATRRKMAATALFTTGLL